MYNPPPYCILYYSPRWAKPSFNDLALVQPAAEMLPGTSL